MHSLSQLDNRVQRASLPSSACNRLDEASVRLSDGVWRQPESGEIRVDILVGTDHMRKLGYYADSVVQLELRRGLYATVTDLGWVLSGGIEELTEPQNHTTETRIIYV